jgi:hypothetical protein
VGVRTDRARVQAGGPVTAGLARAKKTSDARQLTLIAMKFQTHMSGTLLRFSAHFQLKV